MTHEECNNHALTASVRPDLTINRHGEIDEICGTYQATVGAVDELGVEGGFGFPEKALNFIRSRVSSA